VPVPPHADQDAHHDAVPHPVIAAAYAAARGSIEAPPVPARHKAPLRPPSRRAWVAVGLLVALTALPTLVVILAGRAALHGPDDPQPYRADGGRPVVIEPGPDGANRHNDAAVAPQVEGGATPSAPAGAGGAAGGDRTEATPCPTGSGSAGAAGGAAAAGGGAPLAGGGSSGSGSRGDAGSGAQAAPGAPGGGAPGGAPGGGAAPAGGAPAGDDGPAGDGHGSHDGSHDGHGSGGADEPDDDPPAQSGGGSNESAPGRNFIERVFDELGIPIP